MKNSKSIFLGLMLSILTFSLTASSGQALSYEELIDYAIFTGKQGDLEESVELFTKAIQMNPTDPTPLINRAYSYMLLEEFKLALADYSQAIALNNAESAFYNSRAYVYFLQNDFFNALKDYNQAILLDSGNPIYYHNRSKLKHEMQDYDGSKKDFDKACELQYE